MTMLFALVATFGGGGSVAGYILGFLLLCMAPPAATLGLLFAGQRRLASYISLLGMVPCTAPFLLAIIPVGAYGWPSIWRLENVLLSLPFLYTAVTLARVGVGVRVTAGERRQARQLRAARGTAVPAIGPVEEQ
jgi:hypothetical protein